MNINHCSGRLKTFWLCRELFNGFPLHHCIIGSLFHSHSVAIYIVFVRPSSRFPFSCSWISFYDLSKQHHQHIWSGTCIAGVPKHFGLCAPKHLVHFTCRFHLRPWLVPLRLLYLNVSNSPVSSPLDPPTKFGDTQFDSTRSAADDMLDGKQLRCSLRTRAA